MPKGNPGGYKKPKGQMGPYKKPTTAAPSRPQTPKRSSAYGRKRK